MKTFIIEPLAGIREGVRFDMTREEVRRLLAPLSANAFTRGSTAIDGFYGASLQINYDRDGRVEFIEFAHGENPVIFDGLSLLETPATLVIDQLQKNYALDPDEPEPGYSFGFPSIEIGFWRPTIPESEQDQDGLYFESVGFGRAGYYSKKS